jgi:hypothetical protein
MHLFRLFSDTVVTSKYDLFKTSFYYVTFLDGFSVSVQAEWDAA